MSRHIELKDDEYLNNGLRLHGLSVDTPSQLSDAFRSGALYARANTPESNCSPTDSSAAQGAMDTAIADTVLSFIDRMNDVDPVDPADKIVAEFVAAVMPHIDARIQGKRSVAAQPSDATAPPCADASDPDSKRNISAWLHRRVGNDLVMMGGKLAGQIADHIDALEAAQGKPTNFCPQCGKRTYSGSIHTCSPQYQMEQREEFEQGYRRYEAIRKLNVSQFQALFKKSLIGEQSFDDLVDEIIAKGYT